MIKIYNNKINHQLKNKNLFKIVITLKKAKIIIIKKKRHAIYFLSRKKLL